MKVDKEMILAARKTDLVSLLEAEGFTLKKEGKNYRVKDFSGVLVRDNMYTDFANGTDGNAIDFCQKVLQMSFLDAVQFLLRHGQRVVTLEHSGEITQGKSGMNDTKEVPDSTIFTLPERARNNRRVIAYLTKSRGLLKELVVGLIKAQLLYQDTNGNAVFVCRDKNGEAREAIIRGTLTNVPFKKRIGTGLYPFVLFPDEHKETLILTEAPIEALSFLMLYPKSKNSIHAALGGVHFVEAVERMLTHYPNVKRIVTAFNNDEAGKLAGGRMKEAFGERVTVIPFYPQAIGGDWNEAWLSTKNVADFSSKNFIGVLE
jgi:hypothetical protein